MHALNLYGTFIAFIAVVGPPKVLLSFAHLSRTRSVREVSRIALIGSGIAALVGIVVAYTAQVLTSFFHISHQSLQLAGGTIYFIYAIALVMGIHLGAGEDEIEGEEGDSPLMAGIRELMLPFVVSPLAITALLAQSLDENTWRWRSTVAGAYLAVVALDCICVLLLVKVMKYLHSATLEVLSRLLGLLLAAVGVELVLRGLGDLGLLPAQALNRE
ncbi:MarC family protein [Streptacidiphilus sp. PB12-B1b]|uniref:MarC family protein n=1 Tax=Streptacidiphilus sp. PB12-B1b TaxID=2705012 RepID=UPI0015FC0801|nr:MarC family protein [Streptacidiphilus sp. PB12-B1b]QMU76622.1 MarC family protein [Streptacidiphilus sp. PB12-B1b]